MNTFLKIDTLSVDSFIYILGVARWKSSTTKLETKKLWMKWSFKTFHVLYIFLVIQITLLLLLLSRYSRCPTLCDSIDSSPSGSPVPGILQARTLEWVAMSFSSAWKWRVKVKSLSCVWLLATLWSAAYQAPPPMGFSRQEYWSGSPLPSPHFLISTLNVRFWAKSWGRYTDKWLQFGKHLFGTYYVQGTVQGTEEID